MRHPRDPAKPVQPLCHTGHSEPRGAARDASNQGFLFLHRQERPEPGTTGHVSADDFWQTLVTRWLLQCGHSSLAFTLELFLCKASSPTRLWPRIADLCIEQKPTNQCYHVRTACVKVFSLLLIGVACSQAFPEETVLVVELPFSCPLDRFQSVFARFQLHVRFRPRRELEKRNPALSKERMAVADAPKLQRGVLGTGFFKVRNMPLLAGTQLAQFIAYLQICFRSPFFI